MFEKDTSDHAKTVCQVLRIRVKFEQIGCEVCDEECVEKLVTEKHQVCYNTQLFMHQICVQVIHYHYWWNTPPGRLGDTFPAIMRGLCPDMGVQCTVITGKILRFHTPYCHVIPRF